MMAMATYALATRAPLVASHGDTRVPRGVVSARAFPSRSVGSNARATIRSIRERGRGGLTVTRGPAPAAAASAPAEGTAPLAESVREKRRVCIFVEPSPFSHVSGMKNRFLRLIENLTELGDDVVVVTPDRNPPDEYAGAKVIGVHGFKLPFYPGDTLLLSYAKDPRVERLFKDPATRPDVLHCSSPGALIWTACGLSEKYKVPLVQSYHTHIPHYIPRYTWAGLVKPMWDFIRYWTGKSDLTMVTSSILQDELRGEGCPRLQVWQKGVDTVAFNPKFRSEEMHDRLCGGRPGKVIGCVGRLGAEKNLKALKTILEGCPEGTNLALIGDGPERAALEEHFEGTNTTFTGMLLGDDLAAAYASLDVFVMPSESETLGFVVMEAMASGVPVVAVRAGGLQDILTNTPEVGQLYPSNDYAEAARLTTELLTDEKEWTRQRGTCRDAVEEWSWMASNRKLRDAQYPMATRRFDRNQRIRIFVDLVASRRRAAEAIGLLMESQWFVQGASFLLAVGALASARLALGDASVVPEGGVGLLGAIQNAARATGPFAPAVMASAIAFASLVPFVPTQPLFALSGLMFGATEGAVISLVGALEAAAIAFAFIRQQGVGRVANVLAGTGGIGAPARRLVRDQIRRAERAVEDATPAGRLLRLTLYRLAPHAPFTVANYLLGLSKVSMATFVASTAIGLAPWCAFYALVGSAGNALVAGAAAADAAKWVAAGADVFFVIALSAVFAWKAWKYHVDAKQAAIASGSITA